MHRDIWYMVESAWDYLRHHPVLTLIGTFLGLMFPIEPVAAWALGSLIATDTITGYQAAIVRGERVGSGQMFKKAARKLRGYAALLITLGVASLVTGNPAPVRGCFGFLAAIEAFSVIENLYDMELIDIDPRQLVFFKPVIDAVRRRKERRGEQEENS